MFTNQELNDMQEVIHNQAALKPMTVELFNTSVNLLERIKTELEREDSSVGQQDTDLVLVCQDCGEAFDDLAAATHHHTSTECNGPLGSDHPGVQEDKFLVSTRGEQF